MAMLACLFKRWVPGRQLNSPSPPLPRPFPPFVERDSFQERSNTVCPCTLRRFRPSRRICHIFYIAVRSFPPPESVRMSGANPLDVAFFDQRLDMPCRRVRTRPSECLGNLPHIRSIIEFPQVKVHEIQYGLLFFGQWFSHLVIWFIMFIMFFAIFSSRFRADDLRQALAIMSASCVVILVDEYPG